METGERFAGFPSEGPCVYFIIILFKIDVRWASLIDDTLDVLAIDFTDVR